ncbi:hypothetical protein ABTZ44_06445 [Microbacterium oxydans]|uniref:hypothetical protein n=1 Tax=Microbacterium oxydans TaxID=82380 RepID=UPI003327B405
MSEIQQSLIGYAVLRANYNANAPSFLDNFGGFVLDSVSGLGSGSSSSSDIALMIAKRFGINIPTLVVKRLVKRAVAAKIIEGNERSGYRLSTRGAREAPRISEQIVRFEREQAELVAKFRAFLSDVSPQHAAESDADLADQLSTYFQVHSIALLAQALRGEQSAPAHTGPGFDYLISTFVAHLSTTDQTAFGYVENAAKGAILASSVALDTSSLKQDLKRLTVFLDTPVMIDLLGWHGEAAEIATSQLISLALAVGAKVAAFEHSVRELDGVLHNAENALRPMKGNRRSIARIDAHFVAEGYRPADLVTIRSHLEEELEARHVLIVEKPQDYLAYGLDETDLGERLDHAISYRNAGTRNYDVESLSAVHRMRRGSTAAQIERLRAIMVTSNGDVARVASEMARRERGWPLAITDFVLAAVLWVRRPDAAQDLPKRQLVATAYAGMQPATHLWSAYLDEVDRLVAQGEVSHEDAVIFRSGQEPRRALMEVTLGEVDELDPASIQDVLEKIREDYRRPSEERAAQAEREASTAGAATDAITLDWLKSEEEKTSLREQIASLKDQQSAAVQEREASELARARGIWTAAGRSASRRVRPAIFVLAGGFVVLAGLTFFFPDALPDWLAWLGSAAVVVAVIVVVLTVAQLFVPGTVLDWFKPVERRIQSRIAARRWKEEDLERYSEEAKA